MKQKAYWSGKSISGAAWEVYSGDAVHVLKGLPTEHFHCVVTSPPYYWLRDYGIAGQIGHEEDVVGYVQAIPRVVGAETVKNGSPQVALSVRA